MSYRITLCIKKYEIILKTAVSYEHLAMLLIFTFYTVNKAGVVYRVHKQSVSLLLQTQGGGWKLESYVKYIVSSK